MKQDPKKATFLAVLLAVLVVLWGKMMLSRREQCAETCSSNDGCIVCADARFWIPITSEEPPMRPDCWRLDAEPLHRAYPQSVWRSDSILPDGCRSHPVGFSDARTARFGQLAKSADAQADQQHKRENLIQNLATAGQLQLTTLYGPASQGHDQRCKWSVKPEVVAQFRVVKTTRGRDIGCARASSSWPHEIATCRVGFDFDCGFWIPSIQIASQIQIKIRELLCTIGPDTIGLLFTAAVSVYAGSGISSKRANFGKPPSSSKAADTTTSRLQMIC